MLRRFKPAGIPLWCINQSAFSKDAKQHCPGVHWLQRGLVVEKNQPPLASVLLCWTAGNNPSIMRKFICSQEYHVFIGIWHRVPDFIFVKVLTCLNIWKCFKMGTWTWTLVNWVCWAVWNCQLQFHSLKCDFMELLWRFRIRQGILIISIWSRETVLSLAAVSKSDL